MKKQILGLVAALGLLTNTAYADAGFVSGSAAVPSNGQVIADTGAFSMETVNGVSVCITLSTTLAGAFEFQHRNAANSGNIAAVRLDLLANSSEQYCWVNPYQAWLMNDSERFRVVSIGGSLGTESATINYQW